MFDPHLRRLVVTLGIALVLTVGLASGTHLTPTASALPPAKCSEIEERLAIEEAVLRSLQADLRHLLSGGITADEVYYVNLFLGAMSMAQDEITYLKSLMYDCLKQRQLPGGHFHKLAKRVATLNGNLAKLRRQLELALAASHSAHR